MPAVIFKETVHEGSPHKTRQQIDPVTPVRFCLHWARLIHLPCLQTTTIRLRFDSDSHSTAAIDRGTTIWRLTLRPVCGLLLLQWGLDEHIIVTAASGSAVADVLRHCDLRCASGCVVECRICNREVAGSNLSLGYFAPPKSTQPSIPSGSVNEYQLRLGRQRQVWLIPIADERVGVQVKLWNPLRTRAIPERLCGGD